MSRCAPVLVESSHWPDVEHEIDPVMHGAQQVHSRIGAGCVHVTRRASRTTRPELRVSCGLVDDAVADPNCDQCVWRLCVDPNEVCGRDSRSCTVAEPDPALHP